MCYGETRIRARKDLENGYIPKKGMSYFTCPRCGNGTFRSYPQSVPPGADVWTFEFECMRCRHITGLMEERKI